MNRDCKRRPEGRICGFDSCEPSNVLSRPRVVNGRTLVSTLSYGSREGDDSVHLLGLGEVRRVDQNGVLRLDRLGGVPRVPLDDDVGLGGDLLVRRAAPQSLRQPPAMECAISKR